MKKYFLLPFTVLFFSIILNSCSSYDSTFNFEELTKECGDSVKLYNDDPYIVAYPTSTPKAGFVFYPGGLVSYESYLPLMIKCAKKGIACFIIEMPSDFAILDMYAANRVLKRYTDISDWYLGGHSLGGAMAANYISSHTDEYKGLILLAAYSTQDISSSNLKVLCVYGSNDGVLNKDKYEKYKSNLPSNYVELVIEGGNHAQFGNYGSQSGDGDATITASEQQEKTALAIEGLL